MSAFSICMTVTLNKALQEITGTSSIQKIFIQHNNSLHVFLSKFKR